MRVMFSNPQVIVGQLGLLPGMQIADLGAGSGHYTLAAAPLIGGGHVHAVDVQKDLLDKLLAEARHRGLVNVDILWGDLEKLGGTHLKDHSVDYVFVANILFQIEDKGTFVKEVSRITKVGGKVLVVDWADSFGGAGPHADTVVTEPMARQLFEKAGFTEDGFLSVGSHHYGLIFKKNE